MRVILADEDRPLKRVLADGEANWRVSVNRSKDGVWIGTGGGRDDDCTGPRISIEDWHAIVHAVNNKKWVDDE